MTPFTSSVFRITNDNHSLARRKLIVGLERGDIISFREFGRRKNGRVFLDVHQAYTIAVRNQAQKARIERLKVRKAKLATK